LPVVASRDCALLEVLTRGDDGEWRPLASGIAWSAEAGVHNSERAQGDDAVAALALARRVHSQWSTARGLVATGDARGAARVLRQAWDASSEDMLRLGDGHALRLAVARDGMDAALESEGWAEALVFARGVCVASRRIYPKGWPVVGLSVARLAKLELYHGNVSAAAELGEEALRSLTLACGEDLDACAELRRIVAEARAEVQARLATRVAPRKGRCAPALLHEPGPAKALGTGDVACPGWCGTEPSPTVSLESLD